MLYHAQLKSHSEILIYCKRQSVTLQRFYVSVLYLVMLQEIIYRKVVKQKNVGQQLKRATDQFERNLRRKNGAFQYVG